MDPLSIVFNSGLTGYMKVQRFSWSKKSMGIGENRWVFGDILENGLTNTHWFCCLLLEQTLIRSRAA